jgi:hypothetical protein
VNVFPGIIPRLSDVGLWVTLDGTAKPDRSSLLPPPLNQPRPSRGYSVSVSECALSTPVTSW